MTDLFNPDWMVSHSDISSCNVSRLFTHLTCSLCFYLIGAFWRTNRSKTCSIWISTGSHVL